MLDVLELLYYLCELDFEQVASEIALFFLEHELSEGRFDVADTFLQKADTERLRPACLLAILSITWHGRDRLSQRQRFLEAAERKMIEDLGKDRAMKLLEARR